MATKRVYMVDAEDGDGELIIRAESHEDALRQAYRDSSEIRVVCLDRPAKDEPRMVSFVVHTKRSFERAK